MRGMKLAIACVTGCLMASSAMAADYVLTLKDGAFEPKQIELPANERVVLIVKNAQTKPAEFESHSLRREKIIAGGSEAKIKLGPLKPGSYEFFDEFNEKNARGEVVVK